MTQFFTRVVALALLGSIYGCAVDGEFPRLVDIPDAPAQATPMEEKRQMAKDLMDQAASETPAGEETAAETVEEAAAEEAEAAPTP